MSVRVPAAERPRVTSDEFACRIQDFAEKHQWTRFSMKTVIITDEATGGRLTTDLPPEAFAYCAIGYVREVHDQMAREGYNRASLENVKRTVLRNLATAIKGETVADRWSAENIIAAFNDAADRSKEEVVAKFREVCEKLKARAAKKKAAS